LLEAMTRAKPVVASDSGAIPEVIGRDEAGLLAPAGDSAMLAVAIQSVAGSPELRQRLGQVGADRVRELFSEVRMHSRLNEFFRGFLK
jgi:glycosyltransferase involved in cell wall biosynthesis